MITTEKRKDYIPEIFGFHKYGEIINGRLAMVVLLIIIFIEIITRKNIVYLINNLM